MRILRNKFLVKLITAICLVFLLFSFTESNKVFAESDKVWGGVLINPIVDLMTAIGDSIMEILHTSVQSQDVSIIKIDGSEDWWEALGGALAVTFAILAAAVFIVVVVGATGGVAAGAAALAGGAAKAAFVTAATKAAGGALVGGAIAGILTGVAAKEAMIPNDIYLPAFSITAEQIFRNELALFDVNFFKPGTYYTEEIVEKENTTAEKIESEEVTFPIFADYSQEYEGLRSHVGNLWNYPETYSIQEVKSESNGYKRMIETVNESEELEHKITDDMKIRIYTPKLFDAEVEITYKDNTMKVENVEQKKIYTFSIIDETLENEEYLDITYTYLEKYTRTSYLGTSMDPTVSNLQVQESVGYSLVEEGDTHFYETVKVKQESIAEQLQGIVSTWYFVLRNVALLVLMLLLIYSGIRIVIGSTAGEKAKYKERLMDWLVAICLIFVMHYIMVFAVEIVEKITGLVGKTVNGNMAYIELTEIQRENAEEILAGYDTTGDGDAFDDAHGTGEHGALVWPTDLAGLFRIQSQMTETGTTQWVGYSLCYVVLVLFTLFFAFTYARRVLYMAFLTMIAPLVAMTYPIDKITDGKAQAFDSWLKEYIFNLMIQPLHLLLYNILVTSAFALASESPIYALVAIGFMMPAEKLMRRFFGFEKAKTPGLLGGAAGAAIAMTGLQNLMKYKSHGGSSNSGNAKSTDKDSFKVKNRNSVDINDAVASGITIDGGLPDNQQPANGGNEGSNSKPKPIQWYDDEIDEAMGNMAFDHDWGPTGESDNDSYVEETPDVEETSDDEVENEIDINSDRQERSNGRSIGRAAKTISLDIGKNLAARTLRGMHPVRFAGKLAAGATVGTAGLLLGIASGDPNKAFQYTTAGAMAGSALANSLSGGNGNSDDISEDAEIAYYGEEYKQHKVDEQKKAFQRDKANINYIRKATGKSEEEAKQILNTTGEKCFNNGITNVEEVLAIHQLTHGNNKISFEKAVAGREYAKKRLPSDPDKMTEKSINQHKERWANEFKDYYKEKKKKISDEQANAHAEEAFNLAIRYNKAESAATKL